MAQELKLLGQIGYAEVIGGWHNEPKMISDNVYLRTIAYLYQ
jgi:hypothetical protein